MPANPMLGNPRRDKKRAIVKPKALIRGTFSRVEFSRVEFICFLLSYSIFRPLALC